MLIILTKLWKIRGRCVFCPLHSCQSNHPPFFVFDMKRREKKICWPTWETTGNCELSIASLNNTRKDLFCPSLKKRSNLYSCSIDRGEQSKICFLSIDIVCHVLTLEHTCWYVGYMQSWECCVCFYWNFSFIFCLGLLFYKQTTKLQGLAITLHISHLTRQESNEILRPLYSSTHTHTHTHTHPWAWEILRIKMHLFI